MAHHRRLQHDQSPATQGPSLGYTASGSSCMSITGEDDPAVEADEPPDTQIRFAKQWTSSAFAPKSRPYYETSPMQGRTRTESLLTQALLTSPEITPVSDAEAPVLTSDGGLTSPARTSTPSPPPPFINHVHLGTLVANITSTPKNVRETGAVQIAQTSSVDRSQEIKVEEGLGRRRCISFACGGRTTAPKRPDVPIKIEETTDATLKSDNTLKRPCKLRFACPMKPAHQEVTNTERTKRVEDSRNTNHLPTAKAAVNSSPSLPPLEPCDPIPSIKKTASKDAGTYPTGRLFNRVDFQKSEATRFNEFAGTLVDDEWTNEQTAYRQKLTVNDTLRKENAIRQLTEETEEEALDEEAEQEFDEQYSPSDRDEEDDCARYEARPSDDGNETDDEEGFAESDDESDVGSDYQFWTPGVSTAATSTDQVERLRPTNHRLASESSIESIASCKQRFTRRRKEYRVHRHPKMRPGTPELPDTTEFVIGTLDEDRPLEDAYKSCLEERRRMKHHIIPQDIDPSFPTSEPDDEDEQRDDEAEDDDAATQLDDGPDWVTGRPESSGEEISSSQRKSSSSTRATKSPVPSPKRYHSPPPPCKRKAMYPFLASRNLFGQSTRHSQCSHNMQRKPDSPPSSRRPSPTGSLSTKLHGIDMPHLAQRPNLTHTTSLPRTPNPFWNHHRSARFHDAETSSVGISPTGFGPRRSTSHTRGPIDIVQGLERKRQRRKEKYWRQHCRDASKTKERRCQPGKGAERMKELGEMMKDRCKGYGQRGQVVLSV